MDGVKAAQRLLDGELVGRHREVAAFSLQHLIMMIEALQQFRILLLSFDCAEVRRA